MAPVLEVDVDALNADGGRLQSLGQPLGRSNCAPPGSDSVSLGAARALNEHEIALTEVLEYATRVREYGGAVIKSAAVVFDLADRAGAASIHRVDNTGAPPISSSGPPQMPMLPPVPHQPPIASIPELPGLPSIGGEQFSADLHSGPGSADLRDFSRAWHRYSQDITRTADDTRSVGVRVIEDWSSGDKAANNIMDHARWLDSAAAWAERLSVGAEAVARAFDIAKQDTPTPDEFSDAQSDVMEAAALMAVSPAIGMIEYQQATSRYAGLVAKAEEAAKQYDASVSSALTGIGNPIVPCPPIASKADIPAPPMERQPDPEFEFNTRPERLDHTFAEKHKLGGVVQRAGGREEAMRQILDGLKGHVPSQGRFETVINVTGENVTVRGFVDSNGMIKIGTAFIP